MKGIININKNWSVSKTEPINNTETVCQEKNINLPYVFSFDNKVCSFKKIIKADFAYSGRVYLEIKECSGSTEVFVNTELAGRHFGNHTCFRFDITELIKLGEDNTIIITAFHNEITGNSGLIGSVNIILTDKIHFELLDSGSQGIYINSYIRGKNADITIKALINGKMANSGTEYCILDSNNQKVCIVHKPASANEFVLTIYNVKLWNGMNNPYLYTLRARIFSLDSDEIYDEVEIKFGVSAIRMDEEKGFLLNSKPYNLNSVTLEHNIEDDILASHRKDITLIAEMGGTTIKYLKGYYSDSFYKLCDTRGLLVIHDLSHLPLKAKKREQRKKIKSYLTELIKQNYNHPSLCFWHMEYNTIAYLNFSKIFFYRKLFNLIRKLDKDRIIINSAEKAVTNAGFLYDEIVNSAIRKGLITLEKTKSDLYYFYQLKWTDQKFVHICGSRTQYTNLPSTYLKVYSSCNKISIFVNGKHLTSLSAADNIYEVPVDLRIGENRITVNSELNCGDTITVNRIAIKQ